MAGDAYQEHGGAVAIAARWLSSIADVLAAVVRAAQRVDLSEVIRRALRLPLHHTGERRRNQQLHHDPAQPAVSLCLSVYASIPLRLALVSVCPDCPADPSHLQSRRVGGEASIEF